MFLLRENNKIFPLKNEYVHPAVKLLLAITFSALEIDRNPNFDFIRKSASNLLTHSAKMTCRFSEKTTRRIVAFASAIKVNSSNSLKPASYFVIFDDVGKQES